MSLEKVQILVNSLRIVWLEKMVRTMAKDGEITPLGGRKFRRYKLNEDSFLEKGGRK